ncbi:hypothetical protein LUZ61_002429 [Rhynchospora tenuis]|uniref:Aminotransferase-like plant mobile domain-containing protein n=1 Tax=Rhynchospora tenuis TaxID=198213 RepID=A0AAD6ERS8_9POAL|nr:hypothetical protein LUZ61_002429 [Rhynchospora tenuis]
MSSPHNEAGPSSPAHDAPIDPAPRVRRRKRRTGRPNPYNVNPVERAQDVDGQILFLTPEEHIIGVPVEERERCLDLRSHKREIVIDKRIDGRLQKLGLIHISKVKHVNADIALLKALVEFWRPEMHTFHFPVGEMTVTLQDVKYLYGLRTVGKPVTGSTTGVQFDDQVSAQLFATANWAREKTGNRRNIRLKWLRENCSNWPPVGASDDELDRYTRAVAMELFGTLMFPDILQDSGNLNEDKNWNWGGAVLACLYHSLDRAALRFKVVTGPWMLLMFWAWSYISVCRPSLPDEPFPGFGQPDIDSCPPFGRKFAEGRSFSKNTHRGTVEYARDHLATLEVEDVNWLPYTDDRQSIFGGFGDGEDRSFLHLASRPRHASDVEENNALKNAVHAISLLVKKGCRRIGKAILTNCRSQLRDASMPFRIEDLLEQRGLPTKIEDVPDSSEESQEPQTNFEAEDLVNPDD